MEYNTYGVQTSACCCLYEKGSVSFLCDLLHALADAFGILACCTYSFTMSYIALERKDQGLEYLISAKYQN